MASLMDLALQEPSAMEKYASMQSLMGMLGGGPQGPSSPYNGMVGMNLAGAPHKDAVQIARFIERQPGFQVGGLHGFQGQGPISSGHVTNSQHYGKGFAGDVSYVGGGRFDTENAALDWLNRALDARYGDILTELLWEVPDHWDHLHYGTRPGG